MTIGERLSGVDRAWLLMDQPANPMTIMALIVLGRRLGRPALLGLIRDRLLAFDRFRCVPVADPLGAVWRESASFSLDDHLLTAALPAPAGQRELEELAGELASTPFSAGRPLWTFHLIEPYGTGSAIIVRIHHCYGDGIALLHVLFSLAGHSVQSPQLPALPAPDLSSAITAVSGSVTSLLEAGVHYALHPIEATAAAREALGIGAELARLAAMPDDPATRLKRPLSGGRRIAWTQALSVDEVKAMAHVLGCTVNDVLVSTLAGALGRYLESQGDAVAGLTVRAAVPVNLRPVADPRELEGPQALGNRFGLVFVDLPIGMRHPLERLYAVRSGMLALKASVQAQATLGLLSLVGSLPAAVEEFALTIFSAKASLVASNLRGPSKPLFLAGCPVTEALFWVPQSGSIGTGVSMFSYCGRVQFGVTSDRDLIAEPVRLVEELVTEFERLVYLALLGAGVLLD
ncbi:MAG TPA: wax ester/triacylglycerol synthase family O-acyltransferase [Steroidobacteraceae bacterium]|nr:wax ester/triacylglycerol synthase family O-acyltransferase [Steroidobacteraceae bacterium]